MSQNMLPFETNESARFGTWNLMRLKMRILRITQTRSFKKADGLIYLTEYAKKVITHSINGTSKNLAIIPHGIEPRFSSPPRLQKAIEKYSTENPFQFLYVSALLPYKHQIEVAQAASLLRKNGIPLSVRFIGATWGKYGREFSSILARLDEKEEYLHWSGAIPFTELHEAYKNADAFIFASSCENLPNILIEAMSAGLPVVSSQSGPMLEILDNAGLYFDPNDQTSIANALNKLISDPELRKKLAALSWERSKRYSWESCARDTFQFISDVATHRLAIK